MDATERRETDLLPQSWAMEMAVFSASCLALPFVDILDACPRLPNDEGCSDSKSLKKMEQCGQKDAKYKGLETYCWTSMTVLSKPITCLLIDFDNGSILATSKIKLEHASNIVAITDLSNSVAQLSQTREAPCILPLY